MTKGNIVGFSVHVPSVDKYKMSQENGVGICPTATTLEYGGGLVCRLSGSRGQSLHGLQIGGGGWPLITWWIVGFPVVETPPKSHPSQRNRRERGFRASD